MENVTETAVVTTPDETSVTDTSNDVAPETLKQVQGDVSNVNSDTATQEPATEEVTAGNDTDTETSTERKFAGKYDTAKTFPSICIICLFFKHVAGMY